MTDSKRQKIIEWLMPQLNEFEKNLLEMESEAVRKILFDSLIRKHYKRWKDESSKA